MAETKSTQKFYIGEDIVLQFPPLTPEQNRQRCKENGKKNLHPVNACKRKGRSELTKKQWQNPDFREMQRKKMLNGQASLMGRYPKPGNANPNAFRDRNYKLKKCREMIKSLSVIVTKLDTLTNEELDNLYYKLCQW